MAIYDERRSRATGKTKKKKRKSKRVEEKRPRKKAAAKPIAKAKKPAKKVAKVAKRAPTKRPTRRIAAKRPAKKTAARKPSGRPAKRIAANRPKIAVKKPSKRPTKRIAAAKRPAKKTAAKRPKVAAKRPTKQPAKKTAATRRRADGRKLQEQTARLRKAQTQARGAPKRSPVRATSRKSKRVLQKDRIERSLKRRKLPRATKREELRSRTLQFEDARGRFRRLFEHAKATQQLPYRTRLPRTVDSRSNRGEQRMIRIRRLISPAAIENALYAVDRARKQMKGRFSLWYANITFSGLGEMLFGSGNRILDATKLTNAADKEAAFFFQVEGHDNTGVWNSYLGMRERLETILVTLTNDPRTIVYLHWIRLMNFDRKRVLS